MQRQTMRIIVHDTASAMIELLGRPIGEREEALVGLLEPMRAVIPGGGDLVAAHHRGSGFRVDRDDARYRPAIERMREADVWGRVEEGIGSAWRYLDEVLPGVGHAETLHVVLVLGNPDDDHLVELNQGYFGVGAFPGFIHLTMWPTPTSLAKIGYAAMHELHHNVRYSNVAWDPTTVTVGEQVVSEGLAEAFVRELAGPDALGPWCSAVSGEELVSAYRKITEDIDVAGMGRLTPYVHGDRTAARMGAQPVGLPDFAGYAVGLRVVDAHLAASGLSAAASTVLPARDILRNAGVPTNA